MTTPTKRVLSGMRPTGRLQIGNYFGALQNWVRLQDDPSYDCFYFVADWHALTSDYADTSAIAENTLQVAIDFLAAGLDPQKSVIFLQSQVPEHAELHLLLSMITPLGWLERIPTYKEALDNIKDKDLHTYGFLGYPTLQTADIVMYSDPGKPLIVPVGEDQVAHVELSREIVAAFNSYYGYKVRFEEWKKEDYDGLLRVLYPRSPARAGSLSGSGDPSRHRSVSGSEGRTHSEARPVTLEALRLRVREEGVVNVAARMVSGSSGAYFEADPVLTEPSALLTPTPRVPGLDGRKMSKSYGNTIGLREDTDSIVKKLKSMQTDPARARRTDPGDPEKCPVWDLHKVYSSAETRAWVQQGCRSAGIGCLECKAPLIEKVVEEVSGITKRAVEFEENPELVRGIIAEGCERARAAARDTLDAVRQAMAMNYR